jgi:hypothetical protein
VICTCECSKTAEEVFGAKHRTAPPGRGCGRQRGHRSRPHQLDVRRVWRLLADELYPRVLSSNGPRFKAPGRCSLSCPSAARPWLAVQRRRRRAATVQIPQYPARHASSCSSHPHSGREIGPAGRQIAGAADERCSLDCCACVQISAPARRRLFRPAVSRPALAAPMQLSGLVEKPRSLQGPAERACRRRADHDSAPRKEPDGPSSFVASLLLTGAANCSFAEPAPARVNEALAEPTNATSPGITAGR